ncbi:MAG: hypothetical protein AB7F35_00590 [Acetobacteraceae bacterium]
MAELVGLIMSRPTSGERFVLLHPTDISTEQDIRGWTRRYKGFSPELGCMTTVFTESPPDAGRIN